MPIDKPSVVSDRRRIVRGVRGIRGEVEFEARVEPRFDYGRQSHKVARQRHDAVFECRTIDAASRRDVSPLERDGRRRPRRRSPCAAGDVTRLRPRVGPAAARRCHRPRRGGQDVLGDRGVLARWIEQSTYRGRWREAVERSAITLKLMTYAPTGRAGRRADRRAARAGRRRAQLGLPLHLGARRLVLRLRAARPRLHRGGRCVRRLAARTRRGAGAATASVRSRSCTGSTAAPTSSRRRSTTSRATWARGPVRIGNGAADQLQLDIYGEAMNSIYALDTGALGDWGVGRRGLERHRRR